MGLNINVLQDWVVTSNWLIKPTDTGTVLNYRSCAPTQYDRSVILGTVHRIFRSSSNWEQLDKTTETNRAQWLKKISALKIVLQVWRQTPSAKSSMVRKAPA